MVLGVAHIPSCEEIDFNALEKMKTTGKVDHFEVWEHNSEVVFYWKALKPSETKEATVITFQKYEYETCVPRPHKAYLYYDEDGS